MTLATDHASPGEHHMPYVITPFTMDDELDAIVAAWVTAFATPPNGPRAAGELHRQLARHFTYPRFVGLVARAPVSGQVLGLVYGYSNEEGQWWRDQVARALGEKATRLILDNSFCLTELGVIPAARRLGIAQALVNAIEQRQLHLNMVLSTRSDNDEGLRFYRATGWRVLLTEMSFGWSFPPYAILERRSPQG